MKALKDCRWEVEIADIYFGFHGDTMSYCWIIDRIIGNHGMYSEWGQDYCKKEYKTKRGAINNWKKFAEINGITDWKFINE